MWSGAVLCYVAVMLLYKTTKNSFRRHFRYVFSCLGVFVRQFDKILTILAKSVDRAYIF